MATGLIGPFHLGGGKKSRLKKASYEGRIGTKAYKFNESEELVNLPMERNLTVPANSIVFVECDLDFRLPEYIVLRFNLQIRHVHRGLLLGTGPLVDPGYWGKLCIPLHNLTDVDYEIPLNEGLIWIEFTKTTSDVGTGDPSGRRPLGKEFWDIKSFIEKASKSFDPEGKSVPIRSSIPLMVSDANARSIIAEKRSQDASASAKKSQRQVEFAQNIATLSGAIIIVAVLGLWGTFYNDVQRRYNELNDRISNRDSVINEFITRKDSESKLILVGELKIQKISDNFEKLQENLLKYELDNEDIMVTLKNIKEEIEKIRFESNINNKSK